MNWMVFFTGISFLVAAYFIRKGLKRGPSSEKTNWIGPTMSLYVQGWGLFIIFILVGIGYVITSLFTKT